MSGHTPGPWHVELGGFVYSPRTKVADAGFARTEPERTANAYLIAAAPELLEALQRLADSCDESDGVQYGTLGTSFVRSIANAAIAKATGGHA